MGELSNRAIFAKLNCPLFKSQNGRETMRKTRVLKRTIAVKGDGAKGAKKQENTVNECLYLSLSVSHCDKSVISFVPPKKQQKTTKRSAK